MTNEFIYDLCQYILNESESGNALPPNDFTILMQASSLELQQQLFRSLEVNQEVTDALKRFKDSEALTFVTGTSALPTDYGKVSFLLTDDDAWVDICDDYSFGFRQTRTLTAPSATYPIARLVGDNIEILPTTITDGTLYYLREPATPFFDYYYDSDGRIVAFPTGTWTLTTGQIGREGQTVGTLITSEDEELDWNDNEQLIITGMICSKAGANLEKGQVVEYSEMFKQQQS